MKKFLLKFSDSLLSKEQIRSVKGGYDGGGGGGGTGSGSFTLWCYKNGNSLGPVTGSGCISWSTASYICYQKYGQGTIVSNLYC